MDIKKAIQKAMIEKDIQQQHLAEMVGYTKNAFSGYLRKERFYAHDIERIADALGYDVRLQFVDRATGKTIDCD